MRCQTILTASLFCTFGCGGSSGGADASTDSTEGGRDPFDPAAACYVQTIQPARVPVTLVLAVDRSGSMNEDSRWERAVSGVNSALAQPRLTPTRLLDVGLLLFPGSTDCEADVPGFIQPEPIDLARLQIMSVLAANSPDGASTPIVDTLTRIWPALAGLAGRRGVALITDGTETCEDTAAQTALFAAAAEQRQAGILTGVFGIDRESSFLSTLAVQGGTQRSPSCSAVCGVDQRSCMNDTECSYGQLCEPYGGGVAGLVSFCACGGDNQCADGHTCQPQGSPPFQTFACVSDAECCHQVIDNTNRDLSVPLLEFIDRLSEECVFQIPDFVSLDVETLNLGITVPGQPRQIVRYADAAGSNTWNLDNATLGTIALRGPLCEAIQSTADVTVELAVGCPRVNN